MSNKPEPSKKNKYYISKHRYYELKHWVMQYPEWKKYLDDFYGHYPVGIIDLTERPTLSTNPTQWEVEQRDRYQQNIRTVVNTIQTAFEDLGSPYEAPTDFHWQILDTIINGESYDILNAKHGAPFSREYYYTRYRRFFWLLSKIRN